MFLKQFWQLLVKLKVYCEYSENLTLITYLCDCQVKRVFWQFQNGIISFSFCQRNSLFWIFWKFPKSYFRNILKTFAWITNKMKSQINSLLRIFWQFIFRKLSKYSDNFRPGNLSDIIMQIFWQFQIKITIWKGSQV